MRSGRQTAGAEQQLELPLDEIAAGSAGTSWRARVRRGRASAESAGTTAIGWLPVLAVFALFVQVAWLGLRPALRERDRLANQAEVVAAREAHLVAENALQRTRLRALADPIFQERVARARRSEHFATPPRPLDLPLSLAPAE